MRLSAAASILVTFTAALAQATSIAVVKDWATGTNWQYYDTYQGLKGTWVYTPSSTSPAAPGKRGVVFVLVGCGQVATQMAQGGGWAAPAETYGMIVVIPTPINPARPNPMSQNQECYTYGVNNVKPTPDSPDHKALIAAGRAMVADATLNVDPRQIYASGLSAGGTVGLQVNCMAPDLFAGAAVAAAPSPGSNQSQAINGVSITAAQVKQICLDYATAAGNAAALQDHVYAIISDDNYEYPLSASVTGDADNFCPHEYNLLNAQAFADILGLTPAGTGQSLGLSGQGAICGHTPRAWDAKADLYKDAAGRTRLVRIDQDTLGHAWPSGTTTVTAAVTPTVADIKAKNYVDASCKYTMSAVSALNGDVGVLYFNPIVASTTSLDFATFALKLFAENNPRLQGTLPEPPDGGTPDSGTPDGRAPDSGPVCGTCPAGETCTNGHCACTDTSCPSGSVCDATTKHCRPPRTCQSSCPATEPCNTATNLCECTATSCGAGFDCSTTSKQCLPVAAGSCGTCPANETCDTTTNKCVAKTATEVPMVEPPDCGCRASRVEPALALALAFALALAARRRRRR